MIDFTIPTESELSIVEGRNGTFRIKELRVWESHDRVRVYLEGIGAKRGMTIRGGLRVSLECFAEACRRFLAEYGLEGTRGTMLERAAMMEVPAGAKTVSQEWNMRCPECGSDEAIEIGATVYVRLTPDGTDIFDTHNGDHEWDKDSSAYCAKCSHAGTVADFEIQQEGEAHED